MPTIRVPLPSAAAWCTPWAGADSLSIGGGGRGVGQSQNGTFTTGAGGSAVIVAPQGIGHVAGFPDWDGIFVSYNGQEGTATVDADGAVHLSDGAANIQVWGQPVLDYDLTVDANTTLRVIKNTYDNNPATLTLSAGRTLTNHGEVRVDEGGKVVVQEGAGALNNTNTLWLDNGVIELWGRPCAGTGRRQGAWAPAGAHPAYGRYGAVHSGPNLHRQCNRAGRGGDASDHVELYGPATQARRITP